MSNLNTSFKIKKHKCFRDEFVGFEKIKPVNIIIGRNNSGKSSILEILRFLTDKKSFDDALKDNMEFQFEDEIPEDELRPKFGINDGDWDNNGRFLIGLKVRYQIPAKNYEFVNPELFEKISTPIQENGRNKKSAKGVKPL